MRILPVLDLQGGQVVRGIAGRRREYRPIQSPLTTTSAPLDVARAFRTHFDLTTLYLADLDAISGASPAWQLYDVLRADGFSLWIDAGIRSPEQAQTLFALSEVEVVVGLETLAHPDHLRLLVERYGAARLIFSLDLKGGVPLGGPPWPDNAWAIAQYAWQVGVRRLLVLDLAQVGTNDGIGTEELLQRLADTFPTLELTAGGGIRQRIDLERLQNCGVANVLMASALHDRRISRADLLTLCSS